MIVKETHLQGCFIIQPDVFEDSRGYFLETFNQEKYKSKIGDHINFVQDNESFSAKGVLRGFHYQVGEYAQAKLVRVINGKVLDVVVDIRVKSPTFGKHFSIELSANNKTQLFIPKGFAHAFLVLEDDTIFSYKCDNFYNKSAERGFKFNDSKINVNWNFPTEDIILSPKDNDLPTFESIFG